VRWIRISSAIGSRSPPTIVASVSAIFGLGSPDTYNDNLQTLIRGAYLLSSLKGLKARPPSPPQ